MEKVRLINVSQNKDISDFVDSIDIVMPNTNEISSMLAKFTLEQKLIDMGNEIKIDVLDDIGNTIYSLNGEAKLLTETLNYTNLHNYSYEVKDSYSKLFEKNIAETQVFYDLYLCNNADVNNSLMHIIAKNLGFKNLDFHNALYENGQYIRIPFVIFRENEKWIDELQSLIAATNLVLYITAGKLFFKVNNFTLNGNVIFDKTNIITRISKSYKATENNGVKVLYDRYKKLENQIVFNLKSKITVEKNTNKDTEVKSMRISYITSSVAEPSITKATGYYFRTHGDVNSKVDVDLIRDTHYVLEEFTETQAIVKFYNPFNYDLIIDNFEIKGIPLVMYTDNSAIVKNKNVIEKNQENFSVVNKNKYIQTPELAINIAKQIYRSNISSQFSYNLDTSFINNLQLGDLYNLAFENIDVIGRLISYTIQLRPSDFRLSLKLDEIGTVDNIAISYTDSLNSNAQYVDLTNVEKAIEKNKQELKIVQADIRSKLHKIESPPTENVAENDIWLNPKTNVWKKFYNGVWNSISDEEILPSMKMYNSVDTNIIKLQGTTDKVGVYLLNDGEKMGSLNGGLAHTTFDKLGQFEAVNPNNKVALNIKDPANPNRVNSQILLGVTDVNDPKWKDVIFAIGDEASTNRMEFKNGQLSQKINGQDLGNKINNIDQNINNLSQGINDSLNTAKGYADTKKNEAIGTSKSYADSKKTEIENSLKKEITFEIAGEANKYYPVWFKSTNKLCNLVIYRSFNEKAPNSWNTATHKGSLFLELTTTFGSDWDGNRNTPVVHKFDENYTTIASKIMLVHRPGILIWLRGGGAVYHTYTNDFETNKNLNIEVLLQGYDNPPYYKDYPQTIDGRAGTYAETGSANSIKALYDKEHISEVYRRLTNADGKLTQLQQNYQNTVKDVSNFKTQTADMIDTVQGALSQGDFTITGRTNFDGSARFISRGTNEVITILNGSIDFHRDGKKLTRIKNLRYGTISTDSKGKGVVDFEGFKQPMVVLTTIKSANFGKNMASIFCYAEHIQGAQYRFYVGGTNEHYTEAKPIKVVGNTWTMNNVVISTLLGITGNVASNTLIFSARGINGSFQNNFPSGTLILQKDQVPWIEPYRKHTEILSYPKYRINVKRNGDLIYSKDYEINADMPSNRNRAIPNANGVPEAEMLVNINYSSIDAILNILKKFPNRINVQYIVEIVILQPHLKVVLRDSKSQRFGTGDNKHYERSSVYYEGIIWTLTPAHFKGLSITANAETSTLSDVTGTGEVQYIVMEID